MESLIQGLSIRSNEIVGEQSVTRNLDISLGVERLCVIRNRQISCFTNVQGMAIEGHHWQGFGLG